MFFSGFFAVWVWGPEESPLPALYDVSVVVVERDNGILSPGGHSAFAWQTEMKYRVYMESINSSVVDFTQWPPAVEMVLDAALRVKYTAEQWPIVRYGEPHGEFFGSEYVTLYVHASSRLPIPFEVFFLSTFFTSIWVWLYGISALLIRYLVSLGVNLRYLFLDIDDKPLRSLGIVSVLIVTFAFSLALLLRTA